MKNKYDTSYFEKGLKYALEFEKTDNNLIDMFMRFIIITILMI